MIISSSFLLLIAEGDRVSKVQALLPVVTVTVRGVRSLVSIIFCGRFMSGRRGLGSGFMGDGIVESEDTLFELLFFQ